MVPGSRGGSTTFVERDHDPVKFFKMVRFLGAMVVGFICLGFYRFRPVEDPMRTLGRAIERSDLMNGPSPWWGYLILAAAIGGIIYIGWLVLYAE